MSLECFQRRLEWESAHWVGKFGLQCRWASSDLLGDPERTEKETKRFVLALSWRWDGCFLLHLHIRFHSVAFRTQDFTTVAPWALTPWALEGARTEPEQCPRGDAFLSMQSGRVLGTWFVPSTFHRVTQGPRQICQKGRAALAPFWTIPSRTRGVES